MVTLRCANGHEWEARAGAEPVAPSDSSCPVCGSIEHNLGSPPTLPFDVSMPPQAPPALADYEMLEELGGGGMGVFYKARHRSSGKLVAVKVIPRERLGNPDMVSRFRRE